MTTVTFVTTCKGRLDHLQQTLPSYANLPGTESVVVDYDCPQQTGEWVQANFPNVKVVRVHDAPYLNLAKARNLGAAAATSPWLLFIDADKGIKPKRLAAFARGVTENSFYHSLATGDGMMGAVLCARQAFNAVYGYDEAFEGYGGEDAEIYTRLRRLGLQEKHLDTACLTSLQHGDDIRTTHYALKDKVLQWRINALYKTIKHDILAAGMLRELPRDFRLGLMARIKAHVLEQGFDTPIEFAMPDDIFNSVRVPGYRVSRKITYTYQPRLRSKVFGVGLPRTGTASLAIAMLDLGLFTCHTCFDEALYLQGDAFFDTPIYADYAQLDARFPGSKFILSTRDVDAWYASVERSLPTFLSLLAKEDVAVANVEVNQRAWLKIFGTLELNKAQYQAQFLAHETAVKAYFSDRPDDLLVIDLARDKHIPERIARFLGRPDSPVYIPHANRNRMTVDWQSISHPYKLNSQSSA